MGLVGRLALRAMRMFIVLALAMMVVLVFGNVVLRYGFNSGISISEELSRTLFVWLTFVGGVVAMYEHGHLGVDTVIRRLPMKGRIVCAILCDLLMLGCSALLLIGSWKQTLINMDNAAPVSGLPIGLTHLAAFVSSIGLIVVVASHLWQVVTGRAQADDLVQVVDSEDRMPESHPRANP